MNITSVDPAAIGPVDPELDTPENTLTWKWSIGAQYVLGLGDHGSLVPRLDFTWTDERTGLGTSDYVIEGYSILNARLTWRSPEDDWEAAFIVTNVTDEWNLYNAFDLTSAGAAWLAAHPAWGREWALQLRYFW